MLSSTCCAAAAAAGAAAPQLRQHEPLRLVGRRPGGGDQRALRRQAAVPGAYPFLPGLTQPLVCCSNSTCFVARPVWMQQVRVVVSSCLSCSLSESGCRWSAAAGLPSPVRLRVSGGAAGPRLPAQLPVGTAGAAAAAAAAAAELPAAGGAGAAQLRAPALPLSYRGSRRGGGGSGGGGRIAPLLLQLGSHAAAATATSVMGHCAAAEQSEPITHVSRKRLPSPDGSVAICKIGIRGVGGSSSSRNSRGASGQRGRQAVALLRIEAQCRPTSAGGWGTVAQGL